MCFFFFNDTATTEIYTLSLHDALPIYRGPRGAQAAAEQHGRWGFGPVPGGVAAAVPGRRLDAQPQAARSEEHTSELQSRQYLVCRLLLEKKNTNKITADTICQTPPFTYSVIPTIEMLSISRDVLFFF